MMSKYPPPQSSGCFKNRTSRCLYFADVPSCFQPLNHHLCFHLHEANTAIYSAIHLPQLIV